MLTTAIRYYADFSLLMLIAMLLSWLPPLLRAAAATLFAAFSL